MKDVLKQLCGELIKILPPASRRELEVMAWLRDPSFVGKVVTVEIPEPKLTNKPPESMDEYEAMHSNWVTTDRRRRGRRIAYYILSFAT